MCFLPSETGPCRANFVRYYYDRTDGVCKGFTYGGCNGNGNNFDSIEHCLQNCGAAQSILSLLLVEIECFPELTPLFQISVLYRLLLVLVVENTFSIITIKQTILVFHSTLVDVEGTTTDSRIKLHVNNAVGKLLHLQHLQLKHHQVCL